MKAIRNTAKEDKKEPVNKREWQEEGRGNPQGQQGARGASAIEKQE